MKVLVYCSGVIGCYLAHILCTAGNDVTLLARGPWKQQLQQNGLRIRHHLQRKTTLDHPRVIGGIEEDDTFLIFGVSLFVLVVSGWTPLPRWACIFNILPLMLVLMPKRIGGSGNWAGAIMFLGLMFLL